MCPYCDPMLLSLLRKFLHLELMALLVRVIIYFTPITGFLLQFLGVLPVNLFKSIYNGL